MAEMMDLYNEAENSVLGTLIADAEVNASLVFTRVRPRISSPESLGRFSRLVGRCTAAAM